MDKVLEIKNITPETFEGLGVILEHVSRKDGYEPLVTVKSKGWIWAVLTFSNKTVDELECHPTSKESFEPVFGTTIILLAKPNEPEKVSAFLLDKPVMLHESVWHNIVSLAEVSRVKITENNEVYADKHKLNGIVRISAMLS